ncbi:MAG: cobalamin-binding protein [Gloeomargarita sp. DG02_4_bins_56]
MRLVSLLPSATEMVHSLGLTAALVGRSHECDYPPAVRHLPVCTAPKFDPSGDSLTVHHRVMDILGNALSVYQLNIKQLQTLQPTHILTQAQCEVCAVSLRDVEQAAAACLTPAPQIISLQPQTLAQVWQDLMQVGHHLGVEAAPIVNRLQQRVSQIQQATRGLARPRVLCIEWLNPLMSAGNWVPELVELAGGQPLLAQTGQHSPWLNWAEIAAANPDVIVLMPCGYDLQRTINEWQTSAHPWHTLPAVTEGRIYATDGNAYFNRPGPRLVDSLEILAEILHPELDFGHRGNAWCHLGFQHLPQPPFQLLESPPESIHLA